MDDVHFWKSYIISDIEIILTLHLPKTYDNEESAAILHTVFKEVGRCSQRNWARWNEIDSEWIIFLLHKDSY